ncbi:hypothetical protein ACLQ2D_27640 [Streptomyces sp. DT199]|uniref:hypothetical protein n=1 Tax=Streptomyces sp. DT199 TaxID=3393421 RepID=UPI003CFA323A
MGVVRYESYKRDLELLVGDVGRGAYGRVEADVRAALNGQAAAQLRRLVPRPVRREDGAFFTSGAVLEQVEALIRQQILDLGFPARYWDPTCGAGDLLLAAAKQLDLRSSVLETAGQWGRQIAGTDIHGPFVEVARLRLMLQALDRHQRSGLAITPVPLDALPKFFKRISVGDGLEAIRSKKRFSGQILLNPPYGGMRLDSKGAWSSGLTSQAAVFTADSSVLPVGNGGIVAVLPDVLRSGSRYEAWRTFISERLKITDIVPHGLFDDYTDIDVFLMRARRRRSSAGQSSWWPAEVSSTPVEKYFEVRVGTVVDNRDPHEGPCVPYLTARDLGMRSEISDVTRRRNFRGRLFDPPFVVLRRTSRPAQGGSVSRGGAALVAGSDPIAVDNHLIVLSPFSRAQESCAEVIEELNGSSVAKWLDERIRCRHLTVSVVRSIPLPWA